MRRAPSVWTLEDVAHWLEESASTSRRLPAVRIQGHFNVWPTIVRTDYERMASDDAPIYRFPPTPAEIEQMLVVMQWVKWLDIEQRHLVWMRAKRYGWREIGLRFACDRTTAWRHWQEALQMVLTRLNVSTC